MLNTGVFWEHILKPLNGQRQKVIRHLWDNLNVRSDDKVPLIRLKNRFFSKFHPKVLRKETTATKIEAGFLQNIDFHGQIYGNTENFIIWSQFQDFMFCWSSTEEDDKEFLGLLVDCFRLSEFYGIYSEEIPDNELERDILGGQVNTQSSRYNRNNHETGSRYNRNNNINRSRYNRHDDTNRSRVNRQNYESDSRYSRGRYNRSPHIDRNNLYSSNQYQREEVEKSRRNNFYDQQEDNVNIYIQNQEKKSQLGKSRGYNIISGRNDNNQEGRTPRQREKSSRGDIRKNFYDELQGKPDPKRDISQKRINTERRSQLGRSRKTSNRSITRSTLSKA